MRNPEVDAVHLRIEETAEGKVLLTCLSDLGVTFKDNVVIPAGTSREMPTPCEMTIGRTRVYIEKAEEEMATIDLPRGPGTPSTRKSLADLGPSPTTDSLTYWLEGLIVDQGSVSGPDAVYEEAALAVVSLVGLDRALILLRRGNGWEVAAPR